MLTLIFFENRLFPFHYINLNEFLTLFGTSIFQTPPSYLLVLHTTIQKNTVIHFTFSYYIVWLTLIWACAWRFRLLILVLLLAIPFIGYWVFNSLTETWQVINGTYSDFWGNTKTFREHELFFILLKNLLLSTLMCISVLLGFTYIKEKGNYPFVHYNKPKLLPKITQLSLVFIGITAFALFIVQLQFPLKAAESVKGTFFYSQYIIDGLQTNQYSLGFYLFVCIAAFWRWWPVLSLILLFSPLLLTASFIGLTGWETAVVFEITLIGLLHLILLIFTLIAYFSNWQNTALNRIFNKKFAKN